MRAVLGICLAFLTCGELLAQSSQITPVVTVGITPLVVNKSTSIQVLVTNPNYVPVPTGMVTVDFGDGSSPIPLAITNTRVETSHVYTTADRFTISASYSGDANFASTIKRHTAVSIVSAPVYTLRLFGDSLTGGLPTQWPALLTGILGWKRAAYACGGCTTNDMAPAIYESVVDNTYASTWLLGQNETPASEAIATQFEHAALAENAWLAIPEGPAKMRAQNSAVAQTGSWTTSDLFPTTGLKSMLAGSSLTGTIPGNSIFIGLSSSTTTDFTADIVIDGVDEGPVSPVVAHVGLYYAPDVYGLRFPLRGSATATHTVQVVCRDPGTSGCYVDWFGGNGLAQRPNLPPYVWTGVSYTSLQPAEYLSLFLLRQKIVRHVERQLESDGFAIRLADIAAVFNGPATPQCVSSDTVHPNDCGNAIEETVWLSAMSYLATEAQRIDVGQVAPAEVGVNSALNDAMATSRLPVSYSVVTGPASITEGELTVSQDSNVVLQADQAGDARVLPAAPVQFTVPVILPTTTTLSASTRTAEQGATVTLTAEVTSEGTGVSTGTVTFYDFTTAIGTANVNSSGGATLAIATLPIGTNAISASYGADSQYAGSTSRATIITITSDSCGHSHESHGETGSHRECNH